MASGQQIGLPPEDWEICMGPTGLSLSSTDTIENAGCAAGDDNFLVLVNPSVGESYVLLVNEFSSTKTGFTLGFGGDAKVNCMTVSTVEIEEDTIFSFEIYPTYSTGSVSLIMKNEQLMGAKLMIFNLLGHLVYSEESIQNVRNELDLSFLPSGRYFINLQGKGSRLAKPFFIVK